MNDVPNAYEMDVDIKVSEIDQKTSYSSIEVFIRLGPLPRELNETVIQVQVLGGGHLMLFCEYTTSDSLGKYFEGNSSGSWYYIGAGELFPFDYYYMEFKVSPFIDANFTLGEVIPIFHGQRQKALLDIWETRNSVNEIPYRPYQGEEPGLVLIIRRRWVVPFLGFVLPIILCYFFLGASLFMDTTARMQEILTVYLSLFIFVPSFFVGIQGFLPYRSLLSIPEILLTNLITSLGFLGISTMLSGYQRTVRIRNVELPPEWFSLILALVFFIIYYGYLLLPILLKFASEEIAVVFMLVVFSYVFGIFGFLRRTIRRYRRIRFVHSYIA